VTCMSTNMIPSRLKAQLDELGLFEDRSDKIDALIDISERYKLSDFADVARNDSRRVPGCESEVYVDSRSLKEGGRKYRIAVDNPQGISAMALAVILDDGLSGVPVDEVKQVPEDIVFEIFGNELSMGKSLGLTNLVRMVKAEANKEDLA